MIVDAHQHFWTLTRTDYAWLTPSAGVLYRDFLPPDLLPALRENDVSATVLVQAAPSEAETLFLYGLARTNPFVAGVVGWTDFEAPDVGQRIANLIEAGGGLLKGIRPMIQDIPDPDWITRRDLDPAFEAMCSYDLVFEALVRPVHLPALRRRLQRHPRLRAVLDHAAKPDIKAGSIEGWAHHLEMIARESAIHCKLSGLLTEAGETPDPRAIEPFVEHIFASFGPERVVWGSDWPVLTLASGYAEWLRLSRQLIERFAAESADAVLARNAARVYRLAASSA